MWTYILIILFIFCYFRQHVELFGSLCNSDGKYICVETGEIRVSTKMPLITHYVNTCSVIVVIDKDNYLLGHIWGHIWSIYGHIKKYTVIYDNL